MLNLKIFSTENSKYSIPELKLKFKEDTFFELSENLIGIEYFGDSHEYIDILKTAKSVGLSQFLFTSKKFLGTINYLVKERFTLEKINFVYPLKDDSKEFVSKQIEGIYAADEKQNLIDKYLSNLLAEIEWLAVDGCIDIESISFDYQSQETRLYQRLSIYNNGVAVLASRKDVLILSKLLKNTRSSN
ncbi:hypothetical protein [Exiguobacterium sp. S22-S28]|uniref:hypothetical protein n=1 Tax=Exiguobacterium sp. S22-S28 TaxID=3342768 RepID=UPI00372D6A1B